VETRTVQVIAVSNPVHLFRWPCTERKTCHIATPSTTNPTSVDDAISVLRYRPNTMWPALMFVRLTQLLSDIQTLSFKIRPLPLSLSLFRGICKISESECSRPGSSVGTATELRAGRSGIESRWGRDFPPVQTGPGAHPASCTMGTGSFPGLEADGAWGWPPSRVPRLYLYSP